MRCVCSWTEGRSTEETQISTAPSPASSSTQTEFNPCRVRTIKKNKTKHQHTYRHIDTYTDIYICKLMHKHRNAVHTQKYAHRWIQASTHTLIHICIKTFWNCSVQQRNKWKSEKNGIKSICANSPLLVPFEYKYEFQNMYSIGANSNSTLWL